MGTWESTRTPETSELDYMGQNTLHWGVIYIIGKLWKCRCRKWAHMGHLNICSTSYVQKKGQKSNWQFDSWSLKVRNRPDPGLCRGSATHRSKALNERYKFALDLVPIGGLSKKLWPCEVPRVQTGTISRRHLGSPGTKAIRMWVWWSNAENTIWGKVMASPESRMWWVKWVRVACGLSQHQKQSRRCTNQLVGWSLMQDRVTK
jgi:hypothetical protein